MNQQQAPSMNQQQLMKQAHQQKLAFTENQILEQAKRSLDAQMAQMAQYGGMPTSHDLKNFQQQAAANHHAMNGGAGGAGQPRFPQPEFDMNPALKQLRGIADARSNNGNSFPAMNPNAFNNGFSKSNF